MGRRDLTCLGLVNISISLLLALICLLLIQFLLNGTFDNVVQEGTKEL